MMTNLNRYRFYREHKYISFELSELERLIAKSDFSLKHEVTRIEEKLTFLEQIMNNHAAFEDSAIHALLRNKGSTLHEIIEAEHQDHKIIYCTFHQILAQILTSNSAHIQEQLGHELYLQFRLFVSDNLRHLHQEESILMPELQRLYSDQELRMIEFNTFSKMTPEDMAHMMAVLSPHLNPSDRKFFHEEMRQAEPEKFSLAGIT